MKNLLVLIVLVYLTVNITIFLLSSTYMNINIKKAPQLAGSATEVTIETKEYYIPVSKFASLITTTSMDLLNSGKVFSLTLNRGKLPLNVTNIVIIEPTEIISYLEQGYTGLLFPDQVTPKFKTLSIDGQNYWTKSFISDNYPLYYIESRKVPVNTKSPKVQDLRETIFIGGEIIASRAVDRLSLHKNNNYTFMYDFFAPEIRTADLAISMLENPVLGNPNPCTGCMVLVSDDRNIKGLKDVGFDMFSTAGNHAGDGGQKGYSNTIELLKAEGLLYSGTGNTDNAKNLPAIFEMNGKRIGMISADSAASYYWYKGTNNYGTNWFSNSMNDGIDTERVKMVGVLKAEMKIDYLIVYLSWGWEYTNKASKFQEELAHLLIDNGADMIVASHPHWVQNIEFYKDKPIFYALGNFLFDQNHTDPTREGIVLNLHYFNHELKAIDIEPHISCGPFITSKNITNDYLAGKISMETLQTKNEKEGCVYFQPKKLLETDSRYKEILDRLFQYTIIK